MMMSSLGQDLRFSRNLDYAHYRAGSLRNIQKIQFTPIEVQVCQMQLQLGSDSLTARRLGAIEFN
jgi:hypothetical protein